MKADVYFPSTSSAPESLPFILGRTLLSTASTIASARTLRAMRSTMLLSPLPSTTCMNTNNPFDELGSRHNCCENAVICCLIDGCTCICELCLTVDSNSFELSNSFSEIHFRPLHFVSTDPLSKYTAAEYTFALIGPTCLTRTPTPASVIFL